MKRIVKLFPVVGLVFLFAAAGCGRYALEAGFVYGVGCDPPPISIACAYRSEQAVFDADSVSIEFFFAHTYLPDEAKGAAADTTITAYNEKLTGENRMLIKTVGDFLTEKYSCAEIKQLPHDGTGGRYEYTFNHSETLTVPAAMFVGESGCITLSVSTQVSEDRELFGSGSIPVYYKVSGERVTLKSSAFS